MSAGSDVYTNSFLNSTDPGCTTPSPNLLDPLDRNVPPRVHLYDLPPLTPRQTHY